MPGGQPAVAAEQQADDVQETQPLLSSSPQQQTSPEDTSNDASARSELKLQPHSPTKAAAAQPQRQDASDLSKQGSSVARLKSQELGQCRICLEEELLTALETPCGCTGTQRYAHKECIQKWVNEKHHTTCEICDQPYKGDYVVPPSPPASPGEPLTLVSPMGNLYLTVDDERVAGQLLHDVYDEWDDHRQPTVSWCFSFMMLIMFMMILQSTMTVPDGTGAGSSTPGGSTPSPSPATDPSAAATAAGTAAAGLLAGFAMFLVWLLSKLFLVVLPLLMVMRLAARAQEQVAEAAAAAAAAGTVPGLDAPAQGARSSDEVDHDIPLITVIRRLAALRAAAQAGSNNSAAAAAAGPGSADAAVDVEMQQARRDALRRVGAGPMFWAHAVPAGSAANSSRAQDAGQDEGQEQQEVAAAQRLASLRALMRAIRASAQSSEGHTQQQGAADSNAAATAGASGSSRSGMV